MDVDIAALPSDETLRAALAETRGYTVVIFTATPRRQEANADAVIWEHGRRNLALRSQGVLRIVCPGSDGTDLAGVAIFDAPADQVERIMDGDPAVSAGILTYEVHPTRTFPGDSIPADSVSD